MEKTDLKEEKLQEQKACIRKLIFDSNSLEDTNVALKDFGNTINLLGNLQNFEKASKIKKKGKDEKVNAGFNFKSIFNKYYLVDMVKDSLYDLYGTMKDLEKIAKDKNVTKVVVNIMQSNKQFQISNQVPQTLLIGLEKTAEALKFDKKALQEIGWKSWKNIEKDNMQEFFRIFNLDPSLESKQDEIEQYLLHLREDHNRLGFATAIRILKKYNFYDNKELITQLIHMEKIDEAVHFAECDPSEDKNLLYYAIKNIPTMKYADMKTKAIQSNKLNPEKFPDLIEYKKYGEIRAFIRDVDWELAEERYAEKFIGVVLKVLHKSEKYGEFLSVVQRHSGHPQLVNNKSVNWMTADIQNKMAQGKISIEHKDYKLWSCDAFLPHELIKKQDKPDVAKLYLHLDELGFPESKVHWVDELDSEKHQKMIQEIMSCKETKFGVDSEFRSGDNNFEPTKAAILQISDSKNAYIFDCISLQKNKVFIQFVKDFFASDTIVKIGHTFSSDVSVLNQTFDCTVEFNNIVNIDKIVSSQGMGNQVLGLARMCQEMLGKKLDKFNQRSNWCQRPLRKSQLHYAALDAVSCLEIYNRVLTSNYPENIVIKEELKNSEETTIQILDENNQMKTEKLEKKTNKVKKSNVSCAQNMHLLEGYTAKGNRLKFLIDGMLERLVYLLRNVNYDAELWTQKSRKDMIKFAEDEQRVLISRENSILEVKKNCIYINLKMDKPNDQQNFLKNMFNLSVERDKLLGRCVKCNNDDVVEIDKKTAMLSLNWHRHEPDEDHPEITEFWTCTKCKQIYWEGTSFVNAKKRFENFVDDDWEDVEN